VGRSTWLYRKRVRPFEALALTGSHSGDSNCYAATGISSVTVQVGVVFDGAVWRITSAQQICRLP
jgi:hypothetical protein